MSNVFAAEVIASIDETNTLSVKVTKKRSGRLKFDVKYDEDHLDRTFLKGKEVSG